MSEELFQKLRAQLDGYSIGFPAVNSGVELEILRRLFSEEDAQLFTCLSPRLETPAEAAARLERNEAELAAQLDRMAESGLLFRKKAAAGSRYAAIPFIHGLFEFQVKNLDPVLARLMERYTQEAGFDQAMQTSAGAFLRPIPVQRAVPVSHQVAPYEDAKALLAQAPSIVLAECICRKQKETVGQGCGKLKEACFMFGSMGQYYLDRGMGRAISLEEGLAVLAQAAEQGLVTQPGTAQNPAGMCNCCGDCCGVLISLKKHPAPASLTFSNYFVELDRELCSGCETCLSRCQMDAIRLDEEGLATLDRERCLGCGLCVTTCPSEALTLSPKPADQLLTPPRSSADQMRFMAQRRGLI
ncbi:MAG: 4Fe-4S binding protein [Deltaproteobacteria bacterium]|nr:4Fe-4S binding protein [Deltaproteobacteria bacterium]